MWKRKILSQVCVLSFTKEYYSGFIVGVIFCLFGIKIFKKNGFWIFNFLWKNLNAFKFWYKYPLFESYIFHPYLQKNETKTGPFPIDPHEMYIYPITAIVSAINKNRRIKKKEKEKLFLSVLRHGKWQCCYSRTNQQQQKKTYKYIIKSIGLEIRELIQDFLFWLNTHFCQ